MTAYLPFISERPAEAESEPGVDVAAAARGQLPTRVERDPDAGEEDAVDRGGGEPAIICMGGAIANALYDATGARVYQLPLTPERVLKAIRELPGK